MTGIEREFLMDLMREGSDIRDTMSFPAGIWSRTVTAHAPASSAILA